MSDTAIKGIAFVSVYVDDFRKSFDFYSGTLGLKKSFEMGPQACFFDLGDESGLYLQGGNNPATYDKDTMRPSFVLSVESASAMHAKLKSAGVKFVHDAPVEMAPNNFWFMFYDPAGNILEILGGE